MLGTYLSLSLSIYIYMYIYTHDTIKVITMTYDINSNTYHIISWDPVARERTNINNKPEVEKRSGPSRLVCLT